MTVRPPREVDRLTQLFAPVDISFLVFFRVSFGAALLWVCFSFYQKDLIRVHFVEPAFHFTYYGFSWVQPWPGDGMYWHFAALAVLSVFVMAGFLFRVSSVLLCLGFTYVFLLEKAIYLNHYYLMCLLSFVLALMPAHRAFSMDAWIWPSPRSDTAPAWTLYLLRFQVGLPYVFGGLAKINGDWFLGQPMQIWLSRSVWHEMLGPISEERWFALAFSWGGLIFDLAVVPLLLYRPTRLYAYAVAVVFHLMNATMLDIGVFPWLMIAATTVFFEPDWPRRLLKSTSSADRRTAPGAEYSPNKLLAYFLVAYAVLHVLLPFRHWLYPGNVLWTGQGGLFAWHMMLRDKVNLPRFFVSHRDNNKPNEIDPRKWLNDEQVEAVGHDPEMMREFANHLREKYALKGEDIEVHVLALTSLNGRKPQPIIDPRVDLSREPRRLGHQRFIIPLREPFRWERWTVPVKDWEAEMLKREN